jgi:anti-repressor protein
MSALEVFTYGDRPVRTVTRDGEPWFVAADVAASLGYSVQAAMTRTLDDDEKGVHSMHTPGGAQILAVVNEPGLYSAILRSRLPEAKMFKRWLTHEVLPSIRKTGQYVAPATDLEQIKALHAAVGTLLAHNERITAEVVTLTPRAEAWDELASATGDYEVADAAKILARAGVETGRQRLFGQLSAIGWIHRGAQSKWKAYQSAVDSGYVAEKPMSHHHPKSGDLVLDPPQVRVTVRGLERLRVRLGELKLTS